MKWGEVGKNGERFRWVGKEGETFLDTGEYAGMFRQGPPGRLNNRYDEAGLAVSAGMRNVSWPTRTYN